MELGLGSLVGMTMSVGMPLGSCELRKSLGSLSAEEWGCVGWGQDLVLVTQDVSLQERS